MNGHRPIALITGSIRPGRVGLATGEVFAAAGFDLVLTYQGRPRPQDDPAKVAARAAIARASGGSATCIIGALELADPAQAQDLARQLVADLPRLDVLVHNASVYQPTPLNDLGAETLHRHMNVNAFSPMLISRTLAPRLAASPQSGGGAIITLCDIHAMGELGQPRTGFAAYGLSKAALLEGTLVLARELAPRVRVNAVAPGVVAFPPDGPEADPAMQARYLSRVPLGRAGIVQEAAEAVHWLACKATYCSGQVLKVDGGRAIT